MGTAQRHVLRSVGVDGVVDAASLQIMGCDGERKGIAQRAILMSQYPILHCSFTLLISIHSRVGAMSMKFHLVRDVEQLQRMEISLTSTVCHAQEDQLECVGQI